MQKINLKGKLSLNKETVAKLMKDQMVNVIGGNNTNWTMYTCGSGISVCVASCNTCNGQVTCDVGCGPSGNC